MKAFAPLSLSFENRLVWTYATILSVVSFFILLSPVLAQEDNFLGPDLQLEVKKEFDDAGNLISVDSSKTWFWSGKEFSNHEFDSIWRSFRQEFQDAFAENFENKKFLDQLNHPPLHNYWHWNNSDSTAYSFYDDLFDEEFESKKEDTGYEQNSEI